MIIVKNLSKKELKQLQLKKTLNVVNIKRNMDKRIIRSMMIDVKTITRMVFKIMNN